MFGTALSSGGGGVYRPYPVVQVATPRPPRAVVGDPPVSFPKLGQWSPASRPELLWPYVPLYWAWRQDIPLMPVGRPAVPFPMLGGWPVGVMDPAGTNAQEQFSQFRLRLLPIGNPAVPFPMLGGWPVGVMDPPGTNAQEQFSQFRLRLLPIGNAAVPFSLAPYPAQYAGPAWPQVILSQRLRLAAIGADPVSFPQLGAWHPGLMDAPDATEQLAQYQHRLMPIGDAPVPFTRASLPAYWYAVEPPALLFAQRLPLAPVPLLLLGISYPTPAAWYALHLAALQREFRPEVLQQLVRLPAGDPPITFPLLGSWPAGIMDPPPTGIQTSAVRPPLVRIGDAPVPFPPLGRWQPGSMNPPEVAALFANFRLRLLAVGAAPAAVPLPLQWNAVVSVPRTFAPYLVRRGAVLGVVFPAAFTARARLVPLFAAELALGPLFTETPRLGPLFTADPDLKPGDEA